MKQSERMPKLRENSRESGQSRKIMNKPEKFPAENSEEFERI